ncbi:hypothetical protein [Desulfopila sp. IMCC35008]|uniref:hypothetical protein n=1 Tax=Desulfopila sp. IMCC35008 TaxID=2653858 RepID=UPI0013D795AA|nr:hypothetical protein [Desulfopila sp. IMCC35008]
MINPFSLQSKISKLQNDVLQPLYTMHSGQEGSRHEWLMAETAKVIERNRPFLEEVSRSSFIAAIFTIVKLFGGADQLSHDDFNRFTRYVNDGGLESMVKMLLSVDKEKTFLDELASLPQHIRENAPLMLTKSAELHDDFIEGYFRQQYGGPGAVPIKLQNNRLKSTAFIQHLADIAEKAWQNESEK